LLERTIKGVIRHNRVQTNVSFFFFHFLILVVIHGGKESFFQLGREVARIMLINCTRKPVYETILNEIWRL